MSVRADFIYTPLAEVLQQGVAALDCLHGTGIDSYPCMDYLLQSIFLRMTGFSEQKLRTIMWEVASSDLTYRYEVLQGRVSYGEFSSLKDKKSVFSMVIEKTSAIDSTFKISDTDKRAILDDVKKVMENTFGNSILVTTFTSQYKASQTFVKKWKIAEIASGKQLVGGSIEKLYDSLYVQRNRCAHNTLSYQQDSISLANMRDTQYPFKNYFTYFAILLLLDSIFIKAFEYYQKAINAAT